MTDTPKKNSPISIRFEDSEREAISMAAKLEGISMAAYVRRCAILYTREHHPELFQKS